MSERIPKSPSATEGNSNNPENTVYRMPPLERERGPEVVENLEQKFREFYKSHGYLEHEPVLISSGIDPTVRFVGSHISVFKPYLLEGTVPTPGLYMVQDCIRTQNVKKLFDDEYLPKWGSMFTSLGVVAPAERLSAMCAETLELLNATLSVERENIRVRVSSKDADLYEASVNAFSEDALEIDTQPDKYYRHQIGVDGVCGRNFNIALKNGNGDGFSDVGNIILIENTEGKLGVELALGATTILKQLYNADHVNDFYPIEGLQELDPRISRKLEDAIVTSTTLLREGLTPNASDNRGRILRTYMRAILYLASRAGLSGEQLQTSMEKFERAQFGHGPLEASSKIREYTNVYRAELLAQGVAKTPEDKAVLAAITES